MNEVIGSKTAPEFMTVAVQDICEGLLGFGNMTMSGTIRKLEYLHFVHSKRLVCYSNYTLKHGHSFLQIYPRTLPNREILEATYYAQKHLEADEGQEELLFAVASMTVLLTASEEILCGLSPDVDINTFWQAHEEGMCLVSDVMNVLRSVVVG